jgi:hypothetical protein
MIFFYTYQYHAFVEKHKIKKKKKKKNRQFNRFWFCLSTSLLYGPHVNPNSPLSYEQTAFPVIQPVRKIMSKNETKEI